MRIDLDPANLTSSMQHWRDALDMKIPMKDEFKLHFMQQRPALLKNHERTAAAWLMLLRPVVPTVEERGEFDQLIVEIEDFQNWAAGELKALEQIEIEEEVHQGIDQLLAKDPELAARMQEIAKRIKRDPD
jgi:hypothetical protein